MTDDVARTGALTGGITGRTAHTGTKTVVGSVALFTNRRIDEVVSANPRRAQAGRGDAAARAGVVETGRVLALLVGLYVAVATNRAAGAIEIAKRRTG